MKEKEGSCRSLLTSTLDIRDRGERPKCLVDLAKSETGTRRTAGDRHRAKESTRPLDALSVPLIWPKKFSSTVVTGKSRRA